MSCASSVLNLQLLCFRPVHFSERCLHVVRPICCRNTSSSRILLVSSSAYIAGVTKVIREEEQSGKSHF